METNLFEEPVTVIVGLGFPRRMETVAEAHAFLAEWPQAQRNESHRLAVQACKAALAGDIDAQTARGPLAAFARRAGILMSDDHAVVAASKSRGLDGQPPA